MKYKNSHRSTVPHWKKEEEYKFFTAIKSILPLWMVDSEPDITTPLQFIAKLRTISITGMWSTIEQKVNLVSRLCSEIMGHNRDFNISEAFRHSFIVLKMQSFRWKWVRFMSPYHSRLLAWHGSRCYWQNDDLIFSKKWLIIWPTTTINFILLAKSGIAKGIMMWSGWQRSVPSNQKVAAYVVWLSDLKNYLIFMEN